MWNLWTMVWEERYRIRVISRIHLKIQTIFIHWKFCVKYFKIHVIDRYFNRTSLNFKVLVTLKQQIQLKVCKNYLQTELTCLQNQSMDFAQKIWHKPTSTSSKMHPYKTTPNCFVTKQTNYYFQQIIVTWIGFMEKNLFTHPICTFLWANMFCHIFWVPTFIGIIKRTLLKSFIVFFHKKGFKFGILW